jgi:hypothetical protein
MVRREEGEKMRIPIVIGREGERVRKGETRNN